MGGLYHRLDDAVSKHIETFKGWADSFRQDVDAMKAVVASTGADAESRRLAAGALNYLVMKLDLVPDHNEGIGIVDDVMVLRVCAMLATTSHKLGDLAAAAEVSLGRMANEADAVAAFLGTEQYDKLKAYCAKLGETAVRGRTPAQLVADENLRKQLYVEIDDELKRSVPMVVKDPADAELRLKAYLKHKLV
jgi:uncharacterized membrane protein YkvA (DUF1232 family)